MPVATKHVHSFTFAVRAFLVPVPVPVVVDALGRFLEAEGACLLSDWASACAVHFTPDC